METSYLKRSQSIFFSKDNTHTTESTLVCVEGISPARIGLRSTPRFSMSVFSSIRCAVMLLLEAVLSFTVYPCFIYVPLLSATLTSGP